MPEVKTMAVIGALKRLSHHPIFYAAMAGICLQNPSAAYSPFVGREAHDINALAVIQICVGILFLVLFVRSVKQAIR